MKKKYKSYALILLIFIVVPTAMALMMKYNYEKPEPRYGPPHDYWVPENIMILEDDSMKKLDSLRRYIKPTNDDLLALDSVLTQVNNIEKDLDTCFFRIERIESKIDELIKDRKSN